MRCRNKFQNLDPSPVNLNDIKPSNHLFSARITHFPYPFRPERRLDRHAGFRLSGIALVPLFTDRTNKNNSQYAGKSAFTYLNN